MRTEKIRKAGITIDNRDALARMVRVVTKPPSTFKEISLLPDNRGGKMVLFAIAVIMTCNMIAIMSKLDGLIMNSEDFESYLVIDLPILVPISIPLFGTDDITGLRNSLDFDISNTDKFNYISELKKNNSIIYSVSSKFKQSNFHFGIFGKWFLNRLKMIDYFFVQDDNSKLILSKYSIQNVVKSGDSRFTSVIKTLNENKRIDSIEKFIYNNKCFIAGSVWSRDIKIIKESIINSNIKSIVAPHEISQKQINELENIFGNSCVKLSCLKKEEDFQKKVLIVDSIGQLRYIYKYANFCYVGGGFSKNSLHNILEPSVFSCPVIIGNLYYGFKEAEDLIDLGGVLSIKNSIEFLQVFSELCISEEKEKKLGKINSDYVYENEKNNRKVIDSLIKTLQ